MQDAPDEPAFAIGVPVPLRQGVRSVVADEVRERAADRDVEGGVRGVRDLVGQDRDGDAARLEIGRYQGIERPKADLHGEGGIGQVDLSGGIGGVERAFPETGEARVGGILDAFGPFVLEGLDRTLQGPEDGQAAVGLDSDDEERPGWGEAFGGAVRDLPVPEVAPAPEGNGPGPDAAQRERDPSQVALVVMFQEGPLRGGLGRGRGDEKEGGERRQEAGYGSFRVAHDRFLLYSRRAGSSRPPGTAAGRC